MDEWIKATRVHAHTRTHKTPQILFSHKNEGNPAIFDNLDEPGKHEAK